MQVDVVVRGDREAARLLDRLARRLDDDRPQLRGLLDQILWAERARFVAGTGRRWRRLAPSTLRKDAAEGRDPRPMIESGALMRSLTVERAPGQRVQLRPNELRFGTTIYYARFHQRGKGVPKRAVVGLTRLQKTRLIDEFTRLLVDDL